MNNQFQNSQNQNLLKLLSFHLGIIKKDPVMMINIREKINMIIYRDPLLRFVQTGNDPIAILTFC